MNRREYVGTCMPSLPDIVDLTGLCIGRHCHVFPIVYFCVLISKNFLSEKSEPNVSFKFTQRVLDIDYNFYLFVFFFIFLFVFFFSYHQQTTDQSISRFAQTPQSALYDHTMSASFAPECTEAKKAYDNCFNEWYSEKFLKAKSVTNTNECEATWKVYEACIYKALDKKGIKGMLTEARKAAPFEKGGINEAADDRSQSAAGK